MEGRTCDGCGKRLLVQEDVRYEVRIEVRAAYDPLEVTAEDIARDHEAEIRRLLEQMKDMGEDEAMDQVYRRFRFDLCPPCQREYLRNPLPIEER